MPDSYKTPTTQISYYPCINIRGIAMPFPYNHYAKSRKKDLPAYYISPDFLFYNNYIAKGYSLYNTKYKVDKFDKLDCNRALLNLAWCKERDRL